MLSEVIGCLTWKEEKKKYGPSTTAFSYLLRTVSVKHYHLRTATYAVLCVCFLPYILSAKENKIKKKKLAKNIDTFCRLDPYLNQLNAKYITFNG